MNFDPKELNTNQFLGKTKYMPRPTGPKDGRFGTTGRADLAKDQAKWDQAQAWAAENDKIRTDRLAAIETERAARAAEWRAEATEAVLAELRDRYLRSDPAASEEDFVADLPEIQRRRRIDAAVSDPQTRGR